MQISLKTFPWAKRFCSIVRHFKREQHTVNIIKSKLQKHEKGWGYHYILVLVQRGHILKRIVII